MYCVYWKVPVGNLNKTFQTYIRYPKDVLLKTSSVNNISISIKHKTFLRRLLDIHNVQKTAEKRNKYILCQQHSKQTQDVSETSFRHL